MGGKTRRRFAFESDRESAATRHHSCRTCRKRFRWTLLEDEEYDGDDEREVLQKKAEHSEKWEDLELDKFEAPSQKQKFELTASQREKGAVLACPDPWGRQMLTTEWRDLVPLYVGLLTTNVEGWGPGPLPKLPDLNREPKDGLFDHAEKGADLAYPDTWGPPKTAMEDLAPLYKGLLSTNGEGWGLGSLQKRKLLDLNREPEDDLSDQAAEKGGTDNIDLAVVET